MTALLFLAICYLDLYQGAGKRPRQCCHPKGGNAAEGPKGPKVAKTCESEGPKGPRTS